MQLARQGLGRWWWARLWGAVARAVVGVMVAVEVVR